MQINHFNMTLAATIYNNDYLAAAALLRTVAIEIDADPVCMQQYLQNPLIKTLAVKQFDSCLQRVKYVEALSYGDAGALLAAPGAALAGRVVALLGNVDQQRYFSDQLSAAPTFTFLAVTEPNKGSDANHMQTKLYKINKQYFLDGEKWLVGHGADGSVGVVLAKISDKFLGMQAILMTPALIAEGKAAGTLKRKHLLQTGLRGARLSYLQFKNMQIPEECLLGLHLSPIQRGLFSLLKTFNQMRPSVAAFALGHAQAMLDNLLDKPNVFSQHRSALKNLQEEIKSNRLYLLRAAQQIDIDPSHSAFASTAKVKATALAEKIADFTWLCVHPSAILDDPMLMKWLRDVYGFEYMEGTTQIQLKNIQQAYANNLFGF